MARNERHVVKNPESGWDIKKPHAERASSHAETKAEAVMRARMICRNEGAECIIHGEDGKFRNFNRHGRYAWSPKERAGSAYRGMISMMYGFLHFMLSHLPGISGKH